MTGFDGKALLYIASRADLLLVKLGSKNLNGEAKASAPVTYNYAFA
jgi:hypothetical protein